MKKLLKLTAFLLAGLIGHAAQGDLIYGVDSNGDRLVTIDSATLDFTVVGSISTQPISISGLAFSPTGALFGLDYSTGNLYGINPNDVSISLIGATGFTSVDGLAIDSFGNAFSMSRNTKELLSVNLATGLATAIGSHNASIVAGLEFDNENLLYGVNTLNRELVTISTETGGIINSVSLSDVAQGLAFDSSNNLFSVDNGNPERFLSLDKATGGVTQLSFLPIESISDLAVKRFVAVPEPSSLAFCGLSCLGAIFFRRRPKRL
ncbi:hypothetical protein Poly51_19260 [Rubripirellula tenax]|uniref:PEP-CTERM protein-sorting domain-containing protein n=1 Tax=Rubripirellula tenax TaxID=2528015 RepID=A0A5C6FEW0_9BACT|nr:PEP-CTERM sorting domain-containing protein [Rubripirellula tenax]TWU59140.1 hypothetical protein Poly51_19260 [Rubripirellula tenax]